MEILKPRSEYYEFDFGGFCAATAEESRRVLSEYHLEPVVPGADDLNEVTEHELASELMLFAKSKNQELIEQGLVGVDCVLMQGGMVPYFDGGEIKRTFTSEPILGVYQGLDVIQEKAMFDASSDTPILTRPKIVHKILIDQVSSEDVDYDLSYRLRVTSPIDADPPDLMAFNNKADLRNQRWLTGLARNARNAETGQYHFGAIYQTFHAIAGAKYSKLPTQLNLDWFIDHLNMEMGIAGKPAQVYTSKALIHMPDQQQKFILEEEGQIGSVGGRCYGFGIIDTFKEIVQDGNPKVVQVDQPDIALVIEATFGDGATRIVKTPLSGISNAQFFSEVA